MNINELITSLKIAPVNADDGFELRGSNRFMIVNITRAASGVHETVIYFDVDGTFDYRPFNPATMARVGRNPLIRELVAAGVSQPIVSQYFKLCQSTISKIIKVAP